MVTYGATALYILFIVVAMFLPAIVEELAAWHTRVTTKPTPREALRSAAAQCAKANDAAELRVREQALDELAAEGQRWGDYQ